MSAEQTPLFPRVARAALVQAPAPQLLLAGMAETVEAQLEAKIARYQELKALQKEYRQLCRELKELLADESGVKVGRYTVYPKIHDMPEKLVPGHSATRLIIR